jgi:hypothetical protein
MLGPGHQQNRKLFLKDLDATQTPSNTVSPLPSPQPTESTKQAYTQAALQRADHSRTLQALKSRLEYAKWKVEKGWTGIPFEQVCDMYQKEKDERSVASSGRTSPLPPVRVEEKSEVVYGSDEERAAAMLMSFTNPIAR